MTVIQTLVQRLTRIGSCARPEDVDLSEWFEAAISMNPWQAWTLLALVRHRRRNEFVADVMRSKLQCNEVALAEAGAFGHPHIPQSGIVPGMSDWRYYFHGRGCCLTQRFTGESIDVDFFDDTADWFDVFFFTCYLESLKEPSFVERRLIQLHPSFRTTHIAVDELVVMGLLEKHHDCNAVKLTFSHDDLQDALDLTLRRSEEPSFQRLLSAALGDWMFLKELGENVALDIEAAVDDIRCRRSNTLLDLRKSSPSSREPLTALFELGSPLLPELLSQALQDGSAGARSAALTIITELNDASWCDEIESVARRLSPSNGQPEPHNWRIAAEFLLQHDRGALIKQQVPSVESFILGDVAILTLEHFVDITIETFRRALRSAIPINRITGASALAIIDEPWSRSELLAILAESDDWGMTTECRSALVTSLSSECRDAVQQWEQEHPRVVEERDFITMEEMSLRESDRYINWEMSKLHDRVVRLKKRL